jgi:transcriptional regulator with XRE-family HTH domain
MGNILPVQIKTPRDVQRELAARFRARRLSMNLSQEGLAQRSGVSWSSLKRFEHTGLIALGGLLRLALVLDCLSDFDRVCADRGQELASKSLDEILANATPKARRKGRLK